jgi:hypothetical protein
MPAAQNHMQAPQQHHNDPAMQSVIRLGQQHVPQILRCLTASAFNTQEMHE